MEFADHFSSAAADYAWARPSYPMAWFDRLARLAPGLRLAWDCGTGNGQAAVPLAAHFQRVIATEPSAKQLAEAAPHARVVYGQSAETLPGVSDGTVDLVTAAQAAHWFDRERFYAEARRVLRPGGVVALWVYTGCRIAPEIDLRVDEFHDRTVGAYWPPERQLAVTGYRGMEFPFPELPFPEMAMEQSWTVEQFLAYLRTWSAVTRYRQDRGTDPVTGLEPWVRTAWGAGARRVTWRLSGRIGRLAFG